MPNELTKNTLTIKVWPTLLMVFHWSLPLLFILSYLSSQSSQYLTVHIMSGFIITGLIILRLFYAFFGPEIVRYKNFYVSPKALIKHLLLVIKGNPPSHIGHPPPAGWMLLLTQVIVLLFFITGSLSYLGIEQQHIGSFNITFAQGSFYKNIHELLFYIMILLVSTHLIGVIRESQNNNINLALSFITGKKELKNEQYKQWKQWNKKSHFTIASLLMLVFILFSSAWTVQKIEPSVVQLNNPQYKPLWEEECASCHEAYYPNLLTSKNWNIMLNQLEDHFGEDAGLGYEDRDSLIIFLSSNSADTSPLKAAHYMKKNPTQSIQSNPFWKSKHPDIEKLVADNFNDKTPSQCSICHLDAKSGRFESSHITF